MAGERSREKEGWERDVWLAGRVAEDDRDRGEG